MKYSKCDILHENICQSSAPNSINVQENKKVKSGRQETRKKKKMVLGLIQALDQRRYVISAEYEDTRIRGFNNCIYLLIVRCHRSRI